MAEYIDKNAAVGILEAMSRNADCECIKKRLEKAAKRVSIMPAADVVPVVHGKWKPYFEDVPLYNAGGFSKTKQTGWICSVCESLESIVSRMVSNCPNCGAKMDGEAE